MCTYIGRRVLRRPMKVHLMKSNAVSNESKPYAVNTIKESQHVMLCHVCPIMKNAYGTLAIFFVIVHRGYHLSTKWKSALTEN